jgi:hypothetical protein
MFTCGLTAWLLTIQRNDKTRITTLGEAFDYESVSRKSRLVINDQSGRAAIKLPATALMQDDGSVLPRVRLLRPTHADVITIDALERSHWRDASSEEFRRAWESEVASLTAAHRTLPFGSKVRVTNLANNRSVIITINDRGPFTGDRVIDVSAHAAESLGFRVAGVARVKVEPLSD